MLLKLWYLPGYKPGTSQEAPIFMRMGPQVRLHFLYQSVSCIILFDVSQINSVTPLILVSHFYIGIVAL